MQRSDGPAQLPEDILSSHGQCCGHFVVSCLSILVCTSMIQRTPFSGVLQIALLFASVLQLLRFATPSL
jgi:hypothetical protein